MNITWKFWSNMISPKEEYCSDMSKFVYQSHIGVILFIIQSLAISFVMLPIYCISIYLRRVRNKHFQQILDSLPKKLFHELPNILKLGDCYICKQRFNKNCTTLTLNCSEDHSFHEECIREWVLTNNKCPYCNQRIH